ncbi:unnamed protein product [Effrenium voratum]|uniref:Sulfhydryl oxidase n=1 Tax=Effrenium voratum TaxID=2562239 RepID=A0AA36J8H8_9DINO|nr:unnamed protein product [Effrenium voratum]
MAALLLLLSVARADLIQESLSLQNDFWFNHLRGLAPAHPSVIYSGALNHHGDSFHALPAADFYLMMAYSPWWLHCRRAVVEFNRLAASLASSACGLGTLLLDCTRPSNRGMCARFLGEPREPVPLWMAGASLNQATLSDPWPAAAMPLLVLGSKEEFLSHDPLVREGLAVARLTPGEGAEKILDWLRRARPQELGRCSPTLAPAKPPWPLNAHTWEGRTSTAEGDFRRFPEHDVRAGLALWLHEIFERQVWELEGDAPRQRRKKALLDFLKLLCGYFPDHLPGQVGDCRESLCHLGWLLADKKFWLAHTEEVEVSVEEAGYEGRPGPEPHVPPQLFRRRRRFRRILWEKLEHRWRLCGQPWPELARTGFVMCKSEDPMAGRLPCGIWGLMHAVSAEIAELHKCTMAHAENPDNCIGPPENLTAEELLVYMREEAKDMQQLQMERQKEYSEEELAVKPVRLAKGDGWCLKAQGLYEGYSSAPGNNLTAVMRMEVLKGDDKVAGTLIHFQGEEVHDQVELQLTDDFIRKDGGAVVDRVVMGPKSIDALEFRFYKLRTVQGSPVPSKAAPWQDMLQGALAEQPELVFEGPRPCQGRSEKICHQRCSKFRFERVEAESDPAGNVSWGRLVDVSNASGAACVGRIYRKKWFFWSEDVGMGLVPCSEASLFRNVVHGVENQSFCPRGARCLDVDFQLHFEDFPFVAVQEDEDLTARNMHPGQALLIFQRVIALFWRCDECRVRFLQYKIDKEKVKAPCQASLWLWSVHSGINAKLSSGIAQDSPWPGPGRSPAQWPSRHLCPACYDPRHNASNRMLPRQICNFLWNDFYRSWATAAVNGSGRTSSNFTEAWEEHGGLGGFDEATSALGCLCLALVLLILAGIHQQGAAGTLREGRERSGRSGWLLTEDPGRLHRDVPPQPRCAWTDPG